MKRFRIAFISMLTCATFCLAQDYSGTYKDDRLTVELQPAGANAYKGVIYFGDQKYPLTARVDKALSGEFESSGSKFPFTATLENNMLIFETGGMTYRLVAQRAAANPLAQPKQANPLQQQDTPAAHAPPADGVLRMKSHSITDPEMLGGEALRLLAPADWRVEGKVIWRLDPLHPTNPATMSLRAFNPNAPEMMEYFPQLLFVWSDQGIMFFPEGSVYLGNEVRPPIRKIDQFVQAYIIPRFRQNLRDARIVKVEPLNEIAQTIAQEHMRGQQGVQIEGQAARVRFEYDERGVKMHEDVYCVLTFATTQMMPGSTIWGVDRCFSYKAPAGALDERAKVFTAITSSIDINREWFNKYLQFAQATANSQMQAIRAAGDRSRIISQLNDDLTDMRRQAYEAQQASQDRISQNFSDTIRGIDRYQDPNLGRPVELPSGYRDAWTNPQGEYILSNDANFNPNVGDTRSWQRMERPE